MTLATPATRSDPSNASRAQWPVVALLVVSVAINYIDRGNLSIAAPLLKVEMGVSPSQLGVLLSSFFWTYSIFQLVSGWLVDRFNGLADSPACASYVARATDRPAFAKAHADQMAHFAAAD